MKKFLCALTALTMLTSIIPVSLAYDTAKHPIIQSLKNTEHKAQNGIKKRFKKHQRTKGHKQAVKGRKLKNKGVYNIRHGNVKKGEKQYKKGNKLIEKGKKEYKKGVS